MPSLNHVCIWKNNQWQRITVEKAAELHPGGTVSARSGLFMCELCGQYVTFVEGDYVAPHFRHSKYEKDKDCPERTFGIYNPITYKASEFQLPLRITGISSVDFQFELGFIKLPDDLYNSLISVSITADNNAGKSYVYNAERFSTETITYHSVGGVPSSKYTLNIKCSNPAISRFWPETVSGIDPLGCIFKTSNGRKLITDSDIEVGQEYYLLTRYPVSANKRHVICREISNKLISFNRWHLYIVQANDFDEYSAKFFLNFHYRLTENPISVHAVWPLTVHGPYLVKHKEDSLYLYVKGNVEARVFPAASLQVLPTPRGKLIKITCNSRQQLISAGRLNALHYAYYWKDNLDYESSVPIVTVTDTNGILIESGTTEQLPKDKCLRLSTQFDGFIIIKENGEIIRKQKIKAQTITLIDDLRNGLALSVYIGNDCLWELTFKERKRISTPKEGLVKEILSGNGKKMPAPHTLGSAASSLVDYPQLKLWVYKCIRKNEIDEESFLKLQRLLRDIHEENE